MTYIVIKKDVLEGMRRKWSVNTPQPDRTMNYAQNELLDKIKQSVKEVDEEMIEQVVRHKLTDKLWNILEKYYDNFDKRGMCNIPEAHGGGKIHMTQPQSKLTEVENEITKAILQLFGEEK